MIPDIHELSYLVRVRNLVGGDETAAAVIGFTVHFNLPRKISDPK